MIIYILQTYLYIYIYIYMNYVFFLWRGILSWILWESIFIDGMCVFFSCFVTIVLCIFPSKAHTGVTRTELRKCERAHARLVSERKINIFEKSLILSEGVRTQSTKLAGGAKLDHATPRNWARELWHQLIDAWRKGLLRTLGSQEGPCWRPHRQPRDPRTPA